VTGSCSGGCTVTVGDFTLTAGCGETSARGPVKIVARPERLTLLEHGADRGNALPGMVERTVYVGSNLQVMCRLATGVQLQATITNDGQGTGLDQGTPVSVHIPPDALRVLRDEGTAVPRGDGDGYGQPPDSTEDAADRPVRTAPSI
jgi:mannopine transport system ATP-binding protein